MFGQQSSAFFSQCFSHQPQRCTLSLLTTGFLSLSLLTRFPSALAAQPKSLSPTSSSINTKIVDLKISINLGDLIRNLIRYVRVSNISDEEEVELGKRIDRMLLSEQYQRYPNEGVNQYVKQLGQQLVDVSNPREIPYHFRIVVSDNVNAFAIPGGYIYVTTGLLRTAENEAQLASVLAHEIAHVNERHSVKALRQAVLAAGIADTVGLDINTLAQIGYQLAVNLPRGREAEYEADRIGLQILQSAEYPPSAFVNFLKKLENSTTRPEFLRTHPTSANRIEAINQQIKTGDTNNRKGLSEKDYQQAIFPLS